MTDSYQIIQADCLEALKLLDAESVDAVVTDPPAGISFMNRAWDSDRGGRDQWVAWLTDVMRECLRVLKPGGHMLVWALPRASHWTAWAIEDAGFEVRDRVSHLFGTGFPKSASISKQLDQAYAKGVYAGGNTGSAHLTRPTSPEAQEWEGWGTALKPAEESWILCQKSVVNSAGEVSKLSLRASDEALSAFVRVLADLARSPLFAEARERMVTSSSQEADSTPSNTVSSWNSTLVGLFSLQNMFTTKTASALTTELKTLRFLLSKITPESITEALTSRNELTSLAEDADRRFRALGRFLHGILTLSAQGDVTKLADSHRILDDLLQRGETEILPLEPLSEDWWLARKPFKGPVYKNVLKHGTGALNIDATRIPTADKLTRKLGNTTESDSGWKSVKRSEIAGKDGGRWPAHVVFDEEAAAMLDEQSGTGRSPSPYRRSTDVANSAVYGAHVKKAGDTTVNYGDVGGASRFFYVAKPGKKEKNAGVSGKNTHPTVKSVELMRWLVRLVTPPGGTVLDPFCGSGTTGIACLREGFSFIGIEQDAESVRVAEERLAYWREHHGDS